MEFDECIVADFFSPKVEIWNQQTYGELILKGAILLQNQPTWWGYNQQQVGG